MREHIKALDVKIKIENWQLPRIKPRCWVAFYQPDNHILTILFTFSYFHLPFQEERWRRERAPVQETKLLV